jgi:small GTP-binding protein
LDVLRRQLSDDQFECFQREIKALNEIFKDLQQYELPQEDLELLKRAASDLQELFLIVIVGEFNSGKSSVLNALLGSSYLATGVTPTTSKINLIKFGETYVTHPLVTSENIVQIQIPGTEWLKEINLVDTPGTNAIIRGHQELTERFIPRSDFVLFVTSSDRAFTESERQFLEKIKAWKKKIVFVLTKIDNVDNEDDINEIIAFVKENAKQILEYTPTVFPVSSKIAMRAKLAAKKQLSGRASSNQDFVTILSQDPDWIASRFGELEGYILHGLKVQERAQLKLSNPLSLLENILDRSMSDLQQRQAHLKSDLNAIKEIESSLEYFQKDTTRGKFL